MLKIVGRIALAGFLALVLAGLYLHFVKHMSLHLSAHQTEAVPSGAARTVALAPGDVGFHTLDGEPRSLAGSRGKVVFLNRWGTWCAPCVAEMPSIQRLYSRYKDDPQVEFLEIASMDSPATVRAFGQRHHLEMPLYVATDADGSSNVDLATFPTTTLYGKDGSVSSKRTGAVEWDSPEVIAEIERLKRQ